MPKKPQGINTFSGGLNLDFDLLTIGHDMYIKSENGRLLFTDQSSFSWVNTKGNVLAITITSSVAGNYTPIGYAVLNNLLILFSVNDAGDSEIGLITFDENGIQNAYKTLLNDNGFTDKLDFNIINQIEARAIYENDKCHRVYWSDGVTDTSNPTRALTFELTTGDPNLATNYNSVTTSPHSVNEQAEFYMGLIKYKQMISGSLPAGQYVYTYRLLTADGYATPWYPVTRPIFVTQDPINGTNWNEYEMEGTETFVNSGKGNQLTIRYIDQRYQIIEVAYAHYIANVDPLEANIFLRTSITGSDMDINHVANSGEPLDPIEFSAQTISFEGAKTLEIKDNVLYRGNVKERFFTLTEAEQEEVLSGISIEPKFRLMRSDENEFVDYPIPVPSDDSNTFFNKPRTHQNPKTGVSTKRINQGHTEDYVINNDYISYKGTQVSHIYKGHWREEVVRLGIVFFDIIGNPSFAYHLADITVDPQYGNEITWQRLKADGTIQNGNFVYGDTFRLTSDGTELEDPVLNGEDGTGALNRLRILGFEVSGINITNIKSRIHGYKIVIAERDPQILGQGLIMPCVREQGKTTPLPSPTQNWVSTSGTFPIPIGEAGGDIRLLWPVQSTGFYHLEKDPSGETANQFRLRPNTSVLYMPDIDFDITRFPTPQSIDRVKLVGVCTQKAFQNDDEPRYRQWMDYNNYVIQKLDITHDTYHVAAQAPYPILGDFCSIEDWRLADYGGTPGGKIENYQGTLDFYNSTGINASDAFAGEPHAFIQTGQIDEGVYAHGKNRTILMFHGNFGASTSALAYNDDANKGLANYFIFNYIRPNSSPYGGLTPVSIEQTRFITTGHFQPVNNPSIVAPDIINDAEIWGGDCFLDYMGFARLYGIMLDQPYGNNNVFSDYGIGHLFPLESSIHHSLRQATNISGPDDNPMWPDVGLRPAKVFYGVDLATTHVQDGLFLAWDYTGSDYGSTIVGESNVEEFNISDVLFLQAILRTYFGVFSRFKNINHFPIRWRYSDTKIYGELIDRFRTFFANDYRDLKGQYGQITSSEYIFDQIYSFQMKAFGRLRAFDRALLESSNLGTLTTGTGSKLDGIDYISTTNGNQHQWSLSNSGKALYWADVYKRALCRFAQDGFLVISDQYNVHAFANAELPTFEGFDTPVAGKGITSVFDFDNGEVIFSLVNFTDFPQAEFNTKHIIFNEESNRFVDTPTFNSRLTFPFNDGVYFFFEDPLIHNQIYKHNSGPRGSYYGTVYDSKITIVVNDAPQFAKAFDNVRMNINDKVVNNFKTLIMETQEQLETIDITIENRYKYLEQIMRGPLRNVDQNDRMRGKWIKLTFVFDNTLDEKIIFTNLTTLFRISNRT